MSKEDKHIAIRVFGRVQGVNFRHNTKTKADELNIKGFVANLDSGEVMIQAQGDPVDLLDFLQWCNIGEFPAKVDSVEVKSLNKLKDYRSFDILRDKGFWEDELSGMQSLSNRVVSKTKKITKSLLTVNKDKDSKPNVPVHVAIIPDGNRRWARSKGWKPWVGHKQAGSLERLERMFNHLKNKGIKYGTFWGFSTENWERNPQEIETIFNLFVASVDKWIKFMNKEQIRFRHLGRRDRLPKEVISAIDKLEEATKKFDKFHVQLCLDYGGRDEIVRAVNKILADGLDKVDDETISRYLDTKDIPDPDLIVRTSGEQRLSGLLAYQNTYAELHFSQKMFPDFTEEDIDIALADYVKRTRRFGGTAKSDLRGIDENKLKDISK